jgi:hypothetical protein
MTREEFDNMPYPYPEQCEECAGPSDIMIGTGKDFFVWFWCEKCQDKHGCLTGSGDIMAMYDHLENKARARKNNKVYEALTLFKNSTDEQRFNELKSLMTPEEREELRESMRQIINDHPEDF